MDADLHVEAVIAGYQWLPCSPPRISESVPSRQVMSMRRACPLKPYTGEAPVRCTPRW